MQVLQNCCFSLSFFIISCKTKSSLHSLQDSVAHAFLSQTIPLCCFSTKQKSFRVCCSHKRSPCNERGQGQSNSAPHRELSWAPTPLRGQCGFPQFPSEESRLTEAGVLAGSQAASPGPPVQVRPPLGTACSSVGNPVPGCRKRHSPRVLSWTTRLWSFSFPKRDFSGLYRDEGTFDIYDPLQIWTKFLPDGLASEHSLADSTGVQKDGVTWTEGRFRH